MNQVQSNLNAALDATAKLDKKIHSVIEKIGYPEPRQRAHGFSTMLEIIVSQQLSCNGAAVIWARVNTLLDSAINADTILAMDDQKLRDCGLSWRKVAYAKALAEQIDSGLISPVALIKMPTADVIKEMTKIKGYGVWSAEIYAMFSLQRPDVFPAGDLALQIAIQRLENLAEKPSEKQVREIARRWSPHQTAVALLMWRYYGSSTLG